MESVGKTTGGCSVVGDKREGKKTPSKSRRGGNGGTRMHLKEVQGYSK